MRPEIGSAGKNRVNNRQCPLEIIGKSATQLDGDFRIRAGAQPPFPHSKRNCGSADCPDRTLANIIVIPTQLGAAIGSRLNDRVGCNNVEWTSRFCQRIRVPMPEKRFGSQSGELVKQYDSGCRRDISARPDAAQTTTTGHNLC